MIQNDVELRATLERIDHFRRQVEHLRRVETNPTNYRLSAGGFLAEIDRMNLDVREYLSLHPTEVPAAAAAAQVAG
ncbi:MAG: hypothetical protein ACRDJN_06900 [Chloroflexota bacterium]